MSRSHLLHLSFVLSLGFASPATPQDKKAKSDLPGKGLFDDPRGKAAEKDVDLLKLIDPQKHSVSGKWTRQEGSLLSPKEGSSRLQVPYSPPNEYDLEVVVEKIDGTDAFFIGLTSGRNQFGLRLGGQAQKSGLDLLDGKRGGGDTGVLYLFPEGRFVRILCSVRVGKIVIACDDKNLVEWQGDFTRLSLEECWQVPDKTKLFLGSWDSVHRISKLTIRPLSIGGQTRNVNDPVYLKLEAAKSNYKTALETYRKAAQDWFDGRENAARKLGNKGAVDQIKLEQRAFEERGELPKTAPRTLYEGFVTARIAMDKAFRDAIKEYTRLRMDTEAEVVEKELKEYQKSSLRPPS